MRRGSGDPPEGGSGEGVIPSRRLGSWGVLTLCLLGCQGTGGPPGSGPALDGRPSGPLGDTTSCQLTRIVDGDTVQCEPVGRIRLIGMDTPEADQAPFGAQATEALSRLAPVGSRLEVEYDVDARDQYDRVLAYLWWVDDDDSTMLNWALVRQGYALVWTDPANVRYVDALTAAQEAARRDRAGLWSQDGFECPPRDYRAGRCGR